MIRTVQNAKVSGAFVFWDAGATPHQTIYDKLDRIGLKEYCPLRRSPNESLTKAMIDIANVHVANRPKKVGNEDVRYKINIQPRLSQDKNGLECQIATRKRGPNDYDTLFTAKVDPLTERVEVVDGWTSTSDLQDLYNVYRAECTGSSVGQSLVSLLKHYYGTCVRAAGGLYYLPEDATDDWDEVCEAFEQSSKSNLIHVARIVLDERSARTVKNAINQELMKAAGEIAEEIKAGNLTDKAIETRKVRAADIRYKAERYRNILNDGLAEIEAVLSVAEHACGILQAVADSDEQGIFDV